jgi:hypothetical protein
VSRLVSGVKDWSACSCGVVVCNVGIKFEVAREPRVRNKIKRRLPAEISLPAHTECMICHAPEEADE